MAGGLDTEWIVHGYMTGKRVQGMNDQRNGWEDWEKRKMIALDRKCLLGT